MKASTVGIYVLGGLIVLPAVVGVANAGALPEPVTPGSAIAGSAAGLGGLYVGTKVWGAHPFWGGLIGALLGGVVLGVVAPLLFRTSDSTGRASVGLPNPGTGTPVNDADIAATQAATFAESKIGVGK